MNKEEILTKSRKENILEDERIKYIGLKGANYSISVLLVLWVILSRLAPLDDIAKYAMGFLVTATCFANYFYQLVRCKTKTSALFTVLFFSAMMLYLVLFLSYGR